MGFARSPAYYLQGNFWRRFVRGLGAEWVVSTPTDAVTWREALRWAEDDLCLPLRVLFGHVARLVPRVDFLLLPRLVRLEAGRHMCPMLMGLPDLVRAHPTGVEVLAPVVRAGEPQERFRRRLGRLAHRVGVSSRAARRGLREAGGRPVRRPRSLSPGFLQRRRRLRERSRRAGELPAVAVLGHPYLLADDFLNVGALHRFLDCNMDVRVADELDERELEADPPPGSRRIYWSEGARLLAAARRLLAHGVRGIVHVTAFGCGCDSYVGFELEEQMRAMGAPPLLRLVLDEHSGAAGLNSRIEAYCDMLRHSGGARE